MHVIHMIIVVMVYTMSIQPILLCLSGHLTVCIDQMVRLLEFFSVATCIAIWLKERKIKATCDD